jgi:hypothetical protein
MNFDKHIKKLRRVLRTLDGTTDRPIARRNARKRVLGALRGLRGVVDAEYPAIISREGVERLTWEGRRNRLIRSDWESVDSKLAGKYAAESVTVKRLQGKSKTGVRFDELFIPGWAHTIGIDNLVPLRKAVKSVVERKRIIAEISLRK